jgi:D-lactate dehydrogenase (cytochrome)
MIVKTVKDEFADFLTDASNFKGDCSTVCFPESVQELQDIIIEANKTRTPITIAGSGTGLTGGRVPMGGVVISLQQMNKITEINTTEGYAVVEPGVLLAEFDKVIASMGFFYPPDPTEQNSFICANIATNASGAKSFGYGATRKFVLGINVLLPDGNSIYIDRDTCFADGNILKVTAKEGKQYSITLPEVTTPTVKNAAGYFIARDMDAIDLFIGSEGTLGIITSAKLKIIPVPEKMLSCVAFFAGEDDGLNFIDEARAITRAAAQSPESIHARSLEYFDGDALRFIAEKFPQIPANAQAAVWFEQEMTAASEDVIIEKWMDLIVKHNGLEDDIWYASSGSEIENIHAFRHAIPVMVNEYISRRGLRKLGTDTAVPADKFHKFYFGIKELVHAHGIDSVAYGHFGDSHVHLNMLPKNEEEFQTGKSLYPEICKLAVAAGGTISAEHGVGKIKRDMFKLMYPPETILAMAGIKKTLDPNYILNRGNIFDEELFINGGIR